MKTSRRISAEAPLLGDPLAGLAEPEPGIAAVLAARPGNDATLAEVARNLLNYAALLEREGSRPFARRLITRATELLEAVARRQRGDC